MDKLPDYESLFPSKQQRENNEYNSMAVYAYYASWSIYGRSYKPEMVPVNDITHVNYAFLDVRPDGSLKLTDPWADEQIWTQWNDPQASSKLFGNLGALFALKKQHRHLKLGMSVGGWTLSKYVSPVLADPVKSNLLAQQCVEYIQNYGLDYIDLDFEWIGALGNDGNFFDPVNDGPNFTKFLVVLDQKMRQIPGNQNLEKAWVTAAVPADPAKIAKLELGQVKKYLKHFLIMAYDFAGGWDSQTGHQANLFPIPGKTSYSVKAAVDAYLAGGVAPQQIVVGAPLYSRSFANVQPLQEGNGMHTSFNGLPKGSFEAGVYDYKDIPALPGTVFHDTAVGAAWKYDNSSKTLHSYDSPESLAQKLEFIKNSGLGGIMFWELSGESRTSAIPSLIKQSATALSPLDKTANSLYFPQSKFINIRGTAAPPAPVPVPVPGPVPTPVPVPVPGPVPTPVPVPVPGPVPEVELPDSPAGSENSYEGNVTGCPFMQMLRQNNIGELSFEGKISGSLQNGLEAEGKLRVKM